MRGWSAAGMQPKLAGSGSGTTALGGQGCGPIGMITAGGVPPQLVLPGKIGQLVGPGTQPVVVGRSKGIGPSGHGAPVTASWRMRARPRPVVTPLGLTMVSQPRVVAASPWDPT